MTAEQLRIEDGIITAEPADLAAAIDRIRKERLRGLHIRPDFRDKEPGAPTVDLARLREVPTLEVLGITSIVPKRILNLDAIYDLKALKQLGLDAVKQLDLSRLPGLETLFLTDAPGITHLDTLAHLRYARLTKPRADDYSFLAKLPRLTELWLIQPPAARLRGLDASPSLATLEIAHAPKLATVDALPPKLTKLTLKRCPRLRDLSFLKGHPTLDFLFADTFDTVAFIPSLPKLTYLGFQDVLDGNLAPLLQSPSLTKVAAHPPKRKHYTHSIPQLNELLASQAKRG